MRFAALVTFLISSGFCTAQLPDMIPVDTAIYNYQSRLLSQFIDRFNNEDSFFQFKDPVENGIDLAKKRNIVYLLNLQDTALVNDTLTGVFVDHISKADEKYRLSYFDTSWYAVAQCNIIFKGRNGVLSLTLKPDLNSNHLLKWWIVGVNPFITMEKSSANQDLNSLSPYSNEVNFLDLYQFFTSSENQMNYMAEGFKIDYLSLLLYLINNNQIEFKGVKTIDYYFFEFDNWYFKVSNFIRPAVASSGWLISDIYMADAKEKKKIIREQLFTEY